LKIVDVVRKPDGMSDNLRADKDLIADNEAVSSLASRGFFPVQMGAQGEFEVLSANGELNVAINDGVEYVLRFGNVSGLSDEEPTDDGDETGSTGVNRYLLVTTRVDETQFPAPELNPVPQTIEELAALLGVEATRPAKPEPAADGKTVGEMKEDEQGSAKDPAKKEEAEMNAEDKKADTSATPEEPKKADEPKKAEPSKEREGSEAKGSEMKADEKPESEKPKSEKPESKKPESDKPETNKKADAEKASEKTPASKDSPNSTEASKAVESVDEVEVSGSGEATGEGQGAQDEGDLADSKDANGEENADETVATSSVEKTTPEAESKPATGPEPAIAPGAAMEPEAAAKPGADEIAFADLSADEKQERLEAEQEKILKENTRMLDARKDRLNEAKRRVRELNARFADWYYVIPEDTYRELRIQRSELLTVQEDPEPAGPQGQAPLQLDSLNAPK
jgi:hypothetical protein